MPWMRALDGHPPSVLAHCAVATLDVRQVADPAVERLDAEFLLGLRQRLLGVGAHPGKALEVRVDELPGVTASDAEGAGKPERAHPVDDPEVDRLRGAPLLVGDERRVDAEHGGGGRAVDVAAVPEDVDQGLVARDVREHAQLDLAVVGDK